MVTIHTLVNILICVSCMYAHAIAYIALIRTYVFVCNVCVAKNERDDINSFENSIIVVEEVWGPLMRIALGGGGEGPRGQIVVAVCSDSVIQKGREREGELGGL